MEKVNETKSWFFEMVNMDKTLVRLTEKRRPKIQITKVRNERETSVLTLQKLKGL